MPTTTLHVTHSRNDPAGAAEKLKEALRVGGAPVAGAAAFLEYQGQGGYCFRVTVTGTMDQIERARAVWNGVDE